jgi:WD40 repeat protein
VGEPLTGHLGWVEALAFCTTPGGRLLLASGGDDGAILLWDPLTGGPAAGGPVPGAPRGVRALAVAPGRRGRLLLACGGDDGVIRLWHPLTGRPAGKPLTGHDGWVAALAFTATPGGRLLLASGGGDHTARIWDPYGGACLTLLRRTTAVRTIAASGLTLAFGDDNGVTVVDLDEDELRQARRPRRRFRGG